MTAFALGATCGWPSGGVHAGKLGGLDDPVVGEHGPEGQPREPHAEVGQERAPGCGHNSREKSRDRSWGTHSGPLRLSGS